MKKEKDIDAFNFKSIRLKNVLFFFFINKHPRMIKVGNFIPKCDKVKTDYCL